MNVKVRHIVQSKHLTKICEIRHDIAWSLRVASMRAWKAAPRVWDRICFVCMATLEPLIPNLEGFI